MKILHINNTDVSSGGSAIAAYRLHKALQRAGHASALAVQSAQLSEDGIRLLPGQTWPERVLRRAMRAIGLLNIAEIGSFGLAGWPDFLQADVVHFNLLEAEYLSYLALPRLTHARPSVLTLHSMWPMTGHCSFSMDCERWKTGCGRCPYLDAYPPVRMDNTALEWRIKRAVYKRSRLAVICPSRWLLKMAGESILGEFPAHHIPYGVDTEVYRPLNKSHARKMLGLPQDKRVLLFGAAYLDDVRKGADLLLDAVAKLSAKTRAQTCFALLGHSNGALVDALKGAGLDAAAFGFVSSDAIKTMVYSAADAFLFTSRADNLPLVLIESLACGTPIIAFNVGGIPDLVVDGVTGLLAAPENSAQFAANIEQVVNAPELAPKMSANARAKALEEFRIEVQVERHLELYSRMINPGSAGIDS